MSILLSQLTTILSGVDAKLAELSIHPEHGLPGQYREASAYNLNRWMEGIADEQSKAIEREKLEQQRRLNALPAPKRQEPTQEEKDYVRQVQLAVREWGKDLRAENTRPWPSINGQKVPPNLVVCPDGKLRPPVGKYKDCPKYFERKSNA